jgi:hypothetical protein
LEVYNAKPGVAEKMEVEVVPYGKISLKLGFAGMGEVGRANDGWNEIQRRGG